MRTPEEVFDEWLTKIAKPGDPPLRRFHPIPDEIAPAFQHQREKFKQRLDAIQTKVAWKKPIDIYVDFIDDGHCDGRASLYDSKGIVGLYRGLVLLPIDLFLRMFSHPSFLKGVGDTTEERWSAQHGEGVWDDFDILIERRTREGRPPMYPKSPVDRTRFRLADVCADIVWRFLAWHEMVHILHGHLDYLATVPSASRNYLHFQSLELWADGVASIGSLSNLLTTSDKTGAYAVLTNDREKLFYWSLALSAMFRMWGYPIDPMELRDFRHPPNHVRFDMIADGGCSDFARRFPGIGDAYDDIVRQGEAAAVQGIAYCGAERLSEEDVKALNDPLVVAHCHALFDHYHKVLIPELPNHAYLNLVSPPPRQAQTPPAAAPQS